MMMNFDPSDNLVFVSSVFMSTKKTNMQPMANTTQTDD